jgi:Concanavalin A-like lectin/glucanases superfamily
MLEVLQCRRARTVARRVALTVLIAGASGASAATAHAAPSLLGEWRFAETGQTALDGGPFGLDGRLGHGDAPDPADPARIQGIADGALRFSGTELVRLPNDPELAPKTLSVEAVVRGSSSPGAYRYILSRGGRDCFAGAYGLYTAAAGGMAFYVFDGSGYVVTATARAADVWDGAWHHVAGTFDGGRLRLYVDGRPVGNPAEAPLRIDYAGTTTAAAFGRYVGTCDLSYGGDLDLVRLFTGALAPDRIAESAWREIHPTEPMPPLPPLPLEAADPPTRLRAPSRGRGPASTPGAPPRACRMKLSRIRMIVRRRTPIRVRVTLRGHPLHAVRVVAKRRGKRKPITAARTGASGRARLVLRLRRPGRVRISAATKPRCSPGYVRVSPRDARAKARPAR